MKNNTYSYIILGKHIVRVYAWKEAKCLNRKTHVYGSEVLWNRADKYGLIRVALD